MRLYFAIAFFNEDDSGPRIKETTDWYYFTVDNGDHFLGDIGFQHDFEKEMLRVESDPALSGSYDVRVEDNEIFGFTVTDEPNTNHIYVMNQFGQFLAKKGCLVGNITKVTERKYLYSILNLTYTI